MDICTGCKTTPYPRGFCSNKGLCWYCTFVRVKPAPGVTPAGVK